MNAIRRVWNWLDARDQAYSFLVCLCCCVYLYIMVSPVFEPRRMELMSLIGLIFIFIAAKVAMQSIRRMMIWLLVMPFVFSLPLIAYLSSSLNDLANNFGIALIVVVVATVVWVGTALCFDEEKTKRAMSILNDIMRYALALSLVANWYQYSESSMLMEVAKYFSMTPGAVIEASIKIITLPYVLAGIAGMLILNLRQWKIIPW